MHTEKKNKAEKREWKGFQWNRIKTEDTILGEFREVKG